MRIRFSLVALAFLPLSLAAQATVTMPLQDPVYRDLDRLFGSGLVETMIVGQRPYSRREIARIIADAWRALPRRPVSESTQRILARLQTEYARELRTLKGGPRIFDGHNEIVDDSVALPRFADNAFQSDVLALSSPARAIPRDSLGSIAADVNPLLNGRAGRHFRTGFNFAIEQEWTLRANRDLVFRFRPRLLGGRNAGEPYNEGSIEALSATGLIRNIAIEAGRQQFVWGQGMDGGLLGSTSGRPLDMVRIGNDTAARAPWIFSHLGPLHGSLVFIDLGPNQHFPHSNIIAYKLSGNPISPRFEFSASVLSEQGGRGAPAASFLDHLQDLVPALKYTLPNNNSQFSNKFAGWEYRYRIPEWKGLQLYAEHQFDDMDPRRWKSTLWQDGGHIFGLSLSELGPQSDVSAAGEFHHTGLRYYKHGDFVSGIAFNRTLIGDPLGNQGDGGYLRLRWDDGERSSLTLDAAIERRGGDVYSTASEGVHESNFHFVLLESRPAEWRHRATAAWTFRYGVLSRATIQAGYERVRNFAFVRDAMRNNFIASTSVEVVRW